MHDASLLRIKSPAGTEMVILAAKVIALGDLDWGTVLFTETREFQTMEPMADVAGRLGWPIK